MDSKYRRDARETLDNDRVPEFEWKRTRGGRRDWRDTERERAVDTVANLILQEERDEKERVSKWRAEVTTTRMAAEYELAPFIDRHQEHCYRYQREGWDRFCEMMERRSARPRWIRWIGWRPFGVRKSNAICQC
jgi:hypothetical protein